MLRTFPWMQIQLNILFHCLLQLVPVSRGRSSGQGHDFWFRILVWGSPEVSMIIIANVPFLCGSFWWLPDMGHLWPEVWKPHGASPLWLWRRIRVGAWAALQSEYLLWVHSVSEQSGSLFLPQLMVGSEPLCWWQAFVTDQGWLLPSGTIGQCHLYFIEDLFVP